MAAIRVAVLGVGHWHSTYDARYIAHLVDMDGVKLVGVQDDDGSVARKRAEVAPGVGAYNDVDELVRTERPDFVVVLGRHDIMPLYSAYLVDRDIPFLIEKPLARNAEEFSSVAETAKRKHAYVAVPLVQRYQPSALHARRMVAGGEFGELSHFSYRFLKSSPTRYIEWGSPWMLEPELAGGGCLRNFGVHGFDLFRQLIDPDPVVVGASIGHAYALAVEDYGASMLRAAGDMTGIVEVGYTLPVGGRDFELRVAGTRAALDAAGGIYTVRTRAGSEQYADDPDEPPHRRLLRESIECWREGKEPPVGIADCLAAVRLVDQTYAMGSRATEEQG